MQTRTQAMIDRMATHKMEDRIRFGSDGNGVFVVVNISRTSQRKWRLYDRPDAVQRSWERGYLDLWIPEAEYKLALAHLTA